VIRARIKKGWSQAELAEKVGTKQANISRIESAMANPTLNLIQKLCQALDFEIAFEPVQQDQPVQNPSIRSGVGNSTTKKLMSAWASDQCGARWNSNTTSTSFYERSDE